MGRKHIGVGGSAGKQHGRLFDARRRGAVMGKPVVASIMKTVERKGTQFVDVRCVVAIFFVLEGLD